MRRIRCSGRFLAPLGALALGLAACSIPETAFQATPDAGPGSGSGMTDSVAIVVSTQAIEMTEGGSADFKVRLNHAPGAPLEIDLSTASRKLGLSSQKLFFDAANFAVDQTVMVTGVVDDDTATELAEIKLTGTGVTDLLVGATVHDPDKVTIVADITDGATVNEGKSKDVHVHLSHRPTGDVSVSATMSSGPITVSPPSQVFHMDNGFATDVVFTLSAPNDQNVADENQTITFAIAGGDQRIIRVTDVDKDSLSIQTSPQSISHLAEGDSVTLNLTLSLQPASDVTVQVATTSGKAQIGATSVTFKAAGTDYMTNHPITITAPQDLNTTPENDTIVLTMMNHPEVTAINIPVQIDDDDVQAIQTTVVNSLSVTEGMTKAFGATLKFAPTPGNPITVNLSTVNSAVATAASSTGANFLTFNDTNYNDPTMHQVVVQGTEDNNLATDLTMVKLVSGTLETDVPVEVPDNDTQQLVVTPTSLTVPEGRTGTFDVSLKFDPGTTTMVMISDTNATALPVSPTSITFTGGPTGTWATPVHVTVSPPVDTNNVAETAVITVRGGGAPDVAVNASVSDPTTVASYGYPPVPMQFGGSVTVAAGTVIAFKISVPVTTTLDSFGVYIPGGTGDFRMAIYADAAGAPGSLVAAMPQRQSIVAGANIGNLIPDSADPAIQVGTYWVALRIAQSTALTQSTTTAGNDCFTTVTIGNLDAAWPNPFGAHQCGTDNAVNFWINTYHQ
jgi:hypothetical protein